MVSRAQNGQGLSHWSGKAAPWENNAWGNVQEEGNIHMKTSTGTVVALLVCALVVISAPGCNTFRGAGKDIQQSGQAIENAADDAQESIEGRGPYTIAASADLGGAISPSGSTSVPYRSSRTFTVKANSGYHVADVLVDGKSVGAVGRHTFDNVAENHTISALFTPNPGR
jgi:predicted small secreted protein